MRRKRGRPRDPDTIDLIEKLKKIIDENPRWGKELQSKVKSYYEQNGNLLNDKEAASKTRNIVRKLVKDYPLKTKRNGREVLYYFPDKEELAEEIKMGKGGKEEEIELPEKFLPVIKQWIKEFPCIDEYGFGVYMPEKSDKTVYAKDFRKAIVNNIEKIINADDEDNKKKKNGLVLRTYCNDCRYGEIVKLDIEREPLFGELLKSDKRLNYKWKEFGKISAELWEEIWALSDNIVRMAVKEFGLLISKNYVPGNVINSISYRMPHFLLKIIFNDLINIAENLEIEIYGVKMVGREHVFNAFDLFLWDGDKFSLAKYYRVITYGNYNKDAADTFILRINGKGMICLSRQWLVKNYIKRETTIDSQIDSFANFCISHINNLVQKTREGEIAEKAREIYGIQQNLWRIYRELKGALKSKMGFSQYSKVQWPKVIDLRKRI